MKFQSLLITSIGNIDNEEVDFLIKENLQIEEGLNSLNTIEIIPAKTANSIGIGQLKEVLEWINLKSSHMKFVIIRNAETLTLEAQNSLLKGLEEPPDNTLFVLVSKNNERILETIRSRCIQAFYKGVNSNDSEFKEIALKIIKANYLERLKTLETLSKEYSKREEMAEVVFEILKALPRTKNYSEKVKVLKNLYIGVKSGVNLKLCLDLLAIYI